MTFPFVSRLAYDLANRRADAEHENAQSLRRALAELTDKYHALAILQSSPAQTVSTPATIVQPLTLEQKEPKEPDPVAVVIREQSGGNLQLAAHLRGYASQLKRSGKSQDEIIGALVEWQTSEPADHVAVV